MQFRAHASTRFAALLLTLPGFGLAAPFLVEDGEPRASIVIAKDPARSTRLAAAELQRTIAKLSGARLPIAFAPSETYPVTVFVGESSYTRDLELDIANLENGAYRIISGSNWLALLGDDTDFEPVEPWARNNGDIVSGKLQAAWEEKAGYPWGVPNRGLYKHHERRIPGGIGLPPEAAAEAPEYLGIWNFDERGSFNAVCGFLRHLGVRWYMPGEVGEVIPDLPSIPLPGIDETVHPDFPVRQFNVRWSTANDETMWWFMRLGIRQPYGLMVAHGMHTMTHTPEIRRRHPEWFALYGGERDNAEGERLNHLCYANEELFEHTVRWARAQFDIYDYETVSIMPPDAYIAICQCPLSKGKDVPEMEARGKLSDHVWDFVNRVAKEVGKTHPNKGILCCAYGANTAPPSQIDKLEPNVQVAIVGGRRPRNNLPEQRAPIRELREGWLAKTDNPILIFENYPFTSRGWYLPAFTARSLGESINATKDISRGEDIWLSIAQDFDTNGIGFNHFQVYFTARMWWGGKENDSLALLDEYCRLFYGPAGDAMRAFFDFCESNWQAMEHEASLVTEALFLFAAARDHVASDSVYAKRLDTIDEFLDELRDKAVLLSQKRGPVPKLRTVWEPKEPIVIDGRLDDAYWRDIPSSSTGRLRELQTGGQPTYGTSVMAGWDRSGSNLYLGIRCDEVVSRELLLPGDELSPPGGGATSPHITSTDHDDPAIWYGDAVEILLDTNAHRYYQVAVNPSGALADLDRGADRSAWYRWESQAEVATHIAEDHWTVEIRLPVTEDENDPLNQVVGRKPSVSLPWHINICRQRIRDDASEYSALSPTGTASFHEPMKFAHFYDGRSHQFDVDPGVTDFLIEARKTEKLPGGKTDEALASWTGLAAHESLTEFQRSYALARAAGAARRLGEFGKAETATAEIPLESIRMTAEMENLLARRDAAAVVERFGDEDIASWAFWQIGAGARARAIAHQRLGDGEKADSDYRLSLQFTPDHRTRMSLLRAMGQVRETLLEDDEAALSAYRTIAEAKTGTGGADYFYGLEGAARCLSRKGDVDEALRILDQVESDRLSGTWRGSLRLTRAEVLHSAGRSDEARTQFRLVADDEEAHAAHRDRARSMLDE